MKLGLGTVQFGLDYGINNKTGKVLKEEVFKILDFAYNNKIEILDTSISYGESESVLGNYFTDNNTKKFKIVTKFTIKESDDPRYYFNNSLQKLGQDSIYGYLYHNFKDFINEPKTWKTMQEIKDEGKVKKIGFSLYYPKELEILFKKKINFDIIQIPYNIFDQRFNDYFEELKNKNIEIHIRSVFLQGLLLKKINELNKKFNKVKNKIKKLNELSEAINLSVSALCLKFVLSNSYIDKAIIGVDSLSNLKENISNSNKTDEIKDIYKDILKLREEDEKIILPSNW